MKNKKSISILLLLFIITTFYSNTFGSNTFGPNSFTQRFKIGLFDTTNIEKYKYQNFIDIAESIGFDVDYKPMTKLIDNSDDLNLSEYKSIFFIIGIEFLKGIATKSTVAIKILDILKKFGQQNKLVGLVLPPIMGNKIKNKAALFAPIFNSLKINVTKQNYIAAQRPNYVLNSLFIMINNFLNIPMEVKGYAYHTTLSSPIKGKTPTIKPVHTNFITTLPIKYIKKDSTLPYGIYWSNQFNKKQIFITSASLLSFSGISENFHFCPTNYKLRFNMLKNTQQMLKELHSILTMKNIDYEKINKYELPKLPESILKTGNPIKTKGDHYFKKIAWMDIHIFEKTDKKSKKKQLKLVNSILLSGSDLKLWLTLNPHMYYSPIGKKKNNKEIFWKSISSFTHALNIRSKQLNITSPEILIGFETANNLYPPDYPKNCAIDIYGNKYFDIPNPINFSFWKQEIINPLNIFLSKWNNPKTNNGIKIAGIVLDLEMYCRKTANNFLTTTGFSPENIKKFNNKDLKYLIRNNKLQKYYSFLKKQTTNIGKKIKQNFEKHLPNGIISCYAQNISTDWFYKGFYKGLSSKNKPVQLLTFNSEFNMHQEWLEKNKIYAKHSSVLMLSKIKSKKDFWWINKKLKHHHGVWLNKFSRFSENNHKDWMSVEQSQMQEQDEIEFFKMLKNK